MKSSVGDTQRGALNARAINHRGILCRAAIEVANYIRAIEAGERARSEYNRGRGW